MVINLCAQGKSGAGTEHSSSSVRVTEAPHTVFLSEALVAPDKVIHHLLRVIIAPCAAARLAWQFAALELQID